MQPIRNTPIGKPVRRREEAPPLEVPQTWPEERPTKPAKQPTKTPEKVPA